MLNAFDVVRCWEMFWRRNKIFQAWEDVSIHDEHAGSDDEQIPPEPVDIKPEANVLERHSVLRLAELEQQSYAV